MRVPRLVFFFFFFLLSGEMVLHCKQDIYFSVGLNTVFLLCSDIGLWWEGSKGCCSVRGRSSSNSLCQCAEEPPFSLYLGICDIRQPCQTSVHPKLTWLFERSIMLSSLSLSGPTQGGHSQSRAAIPTERQVLRAGTPHGADSLQQEPAQCHL